MNFDEQSHQISEYLSLRARRAQLKQTYEKFDNELVEKQEVIERNFVGLLKTTGGSVSLPVGRAHHTIKSQKQIVDTEALYDYIAESPRERLYLLQRRVASKNHDDYCNEQGISRVPGLAYVENHSVIFSKSTKTRAKT